MINIEVLILYMFKTAFYGFLLFLFISFVTRVFIWKRNKLTD